MDEKKLTSNELNKVSGGSFNESNNYNATINKYAYIIHRYNENWCEYGYLNVGTRINIVSELTIWDNLYYEFTINEVSEHLYVVNSYVTKDNA